MSIIEKIKKAGEQYNSSLTKIGELLDELAGEIEEGLKGLGKVDFHHGNVRFTSYGPCSNVGCLGSAFWYYEDGYSSLASTIREPGTSFYLHGDFNCRVRVATRGERREVARQIPEFLQEFSEWLEDNVKKAGEEQQKLQEVIEKLKSLDITHTKNL